MDSSEEYETEYYEWMEDMAEHCSCCPQCSDCPCDGVLAGGMATWWGVHAMNRMDNRLN